MKKLLIATLLALSFTTFALAESTGTHLYLRATVTCPGETDKRPITLITDTYRDRCELVPVSDNRWECEDSTARIILKKFKHKDKYRLYIRSSK